MGTHTTHKQAGRIHHTQHRWEIPSVACNCAHLLCSHPLMLLRSAPGFGPLQQDAKGRRPEAVGRISHSGCVY